MANIVMGEPLNRWLIGHLSIVIGKVRIDDQNNHYGFTCCRTRFVRFAFIAGIAHSNSKIIAKPIRTGNLVQRIVAFE